MQLKQGAIMEMVRIIREEEPSKPSTRLSSDGSLPSLAALRKTDPKRLMARTIGQAYSDLGEYATSQMHFEAAEDLYRQNLGSEHPERLSSLMSLGSVYSAQDEFELAEQLLTECVDGYGRTFGDEHRLTLRAWRSLADTLSRIGDPAKTALATQMFRDVAASCRQLFRSDDPDLHDALNSLAMHYRFLASNPNDGRMLESAEAILEEVLSITSHVRNEDPAKLFILSNRALIASDKLQFDKALDLWKEVLEGCRQAFGEVHPYTARAMHDLASAYSQQSQLAEAEQLYRKALEIRRQLHGNDHSSTERAIFSLGQFYLNQSQFEKAASYYEERLARNRRVFGNQAINTHLACRDLASVYVNLGRNADAEKMLDEAIDGLQQYKPDDDPILNLTREYLADLYVAQGRFEEALSIYRDAVAILRSQPTPPPIDLASTLTALGQALLATENFVDAEAAYRETAAIYQRHIPNAWPAFFFELQIGTALVGQGRYAEAEPLMLESYSGLKARESSVPPTIMLESIEHLAELYDAWDQPDTAAQWRDLLP